MASIKQIKKNIRISKVKKAIEARIKNESDFEKLSELEKYNFKKSECRKIAKYYWRLSTEEFNKNACKIGLFSDDVITEKEQKRYFRVSNEIDACGTSLLKYSDTREKPPVIKYMTRFCHNKFCPLCIWRTSKKQFKLMNDIVSHPKMKDCAYIFMTLTVKNCSADDLSKTIDLLLCGFKSLTTNKTCQFAKRFLGIFRCLESTYNTRTHEYHPHLHLLIAIDKSYFKDTKKYLTKSELIKIWRRACNLDYDPSVDIRCTYNSEAKCIAEVSKYTVKTSEIVNPNVLRVYDKSFFKRRLKSYTGLFKEVKQEVIEQWKSQKSDCASYNEIMANPAFIKELYKWDCFKNEFVLSMTNKDFKQERIDKNKVVESIINYIDDYDDLD